MHDKYLASKGIRSISVKNYMLLYKVNSEVYCHNEKLILLFGLARVWSIRIMVLVYALAGLSITEGLVKPLLHKIFYGGWRGS